MRRPGFPYVPALVILAVTVLLTAIFGVVYVQGVAQSAKEDFYSLTDLTSQIFSESIRAEMSSDQLRSITRSFVRGDVLYAALISDGEIAFLDRINSAAGIELPISDFNGRFAQREMALANGTPYLDVMRPVLGASGSYVRIGFSMREIENRVLSATLFVFQIGLGVLLVVGVLVGISLWIVGRQTEPAPVLEMYTPMDFPDPFTYDPSSEDGATRRIIEAGPLKIDVTSKIVSVHGEAIELSPKEFDLVSLLAAAPGKVFSNDEILEQVWADGFTATSKDVKQYIYLLRRKLEPDPEKPSLIVTVRGFGYKLEIEQKNPT